MKMYTVRKIIFFVASICIGVFFVLRPWKQIPRVARNDKRNVIPSNARDLKQNDKKIPPFGRNDTAPQNLGSLMRQVHFAYRPNENGFEGGHTTYAVRVNSQGSVEFTPANYKETKIIRGEPFVFKTKSISRGQNELAKAQPKIAVGKKGQLEIVHTEIIETLQNSEKGVEQSWYFDKKPKGIGDLVVNVNTSGQKYIGATKTGLHFQDPKTGLGAKYGWATWIDAQGKREEFRGQIEKQNIVMRVPSSTIEQSQYPAVLDPTIGTEQGIDNTVNGIAYATQQLAQIAYDGTNALVVWEDYRTNIPPVTTSYSTIWGARVSDAGTVLDSNGIAIARNSTYQVFPAVSHNGTNYLAVWYEERAGVFGCYGARVSDAGSLLDSNGITISTAGSGAPAVASDGTNSLVVWPDRRASPGGGPTEIYGARVSSAGTVLDSSGIAISTQTQTQYSPSVAYDGVETYLVVWVDTRNSNNDIYGATVSTSGDVDPAAGTAICTDANAQLSPDVETHLGTNRQLVTWTDYRNGNNDIYGARVYRGTVQVADIVISTASNGQQDSAVAEDGTNFWVVWSDYRTDGVQTDIYGARKYFPILK